jgi:iron complex transport system substrate-binding protein
MRIVSLLPSATELICGLGLRDSLIGVSHECDWPPDVVGLPVLTRSRVPPGLPSAEIDQLVRVRLEQVSALYDLELDTLQALAPDLIVTQALCDVCAVSASDVARALGSLPGAPRLVNLEPVCLDDVFETVMLVAREAGRPQRGLDYVSHLRARMDAVAARSSQLRGARPRVASLDWLDPLFDGGHWVPELVELAGGEPCLGAARTASRRRSWDELLEARPDVIVVALCGFDVPRTLQDVGQHLFGHPGWRELRARAGPQVVVIDGNAYFSRPGPRLIDSLEILAHALHPDLHPLPPGLQAAMRLVPPADAG